MEAPRPAIQSKNAISLFCFLCRYPPRDAPQVQRAALDCSGGDAGCCSQIDKPEEKGEESAGLGGAALYMEGGQL